MSAADPTIQTRSLTAGMPAADESLTTRVFKRGYRWLQFPEPLESQFREDHRVNSHRLVRMSVIVAFITSAGFALIDHKVIQAVNAAPDLVRFGLQFPILITILLATSRRFYLRWYEPAIKFGLPLFGLGTVIMTSYAPAESVPLVGARLMLVTFFCYFMLGLRMRAALACNTAVFAFLVGALLMGRLPTEIGFYMVFALLCANIIGSVGAYALEHASRTAFLERQSLEEMAARDGLTRLLNRQTFEFRARNLWRAATTLQRPVSMLMIDVDYFKRYNDHYGHQAGDECLRRVAAAVRAAVNPARDELVARYGGEEIIAMLVDRSEEQVASVALEIVANVIRLEIPHDASVVCDHVSVSVGATTPSVDNDIAYGALANLADKALYVAKKRGRNRCVILRSDVAAATEEEEFEAATRPEARTVLTSESLERSPLRGSVAL